MTQFFTKQTLSFLAELKDNNNRDWFAENKSRYEEHIVDPALLFIQAMSKPIHAISPLYTAILKKVGGSLFRIYRDARFSQGKSPYKTQIGIHFRHKMSKDAHTPGFYLHIEAGRCFIAAGIWRPAAADLHNIRLWLADNHTKWQKLVNDKGFNSNFVMGGDRLKRNPKGYPIDHPAIEYLKYKDFIAVSAIDDQLPLADGFDTVCGQQFSQAAGMNAALCEALNLQFEAQGTKT